MPQRVPSELAALRLESPVRAMLTGIATMPEHESPISTHVAGGNPMAQGQTLRWKIQGQHAIFPATPERRPAMLSYLQSLKNHQPPTPVRTLLPTSCCVCRAQPLLGLGSGRLRALFAQFYYLWLLRILRCLTKKTFSRCI